MSISICLVTFLCVLGLISTVQGIPTLTARQSITALSPAQIAAFKPFASFASASYCSPSLTKTWSCGGMYGGRRLSFGMLNPGQLTVMLKQTLCLLPQEGMGRRYSFVCLHWDKVSLIYYNLWTYTRVCRIFAFLEDCCRGPPRDRCVQDVRHSNFLRSHCRVTNHRTF